MATKNYIGVNGLVTQDLDEIIEDLQSQFKEIYGQNVNLDQNSPDGQWINILAQEKKDLLDLVTQIYNGFDVDSAVGLPQQVLYKLNGLKIKAFTFSYCYVNVVITKAVTLNGLDDNIESEDAVGFTVSDSAGNNWILAETQVLQPGTHVLNFRSQVAGNVTALPNTINIMSTILAGVAGVNNVDKNYITGNVGESAAEFRFRRNQTMAVPSQGFIESIQSQLLNITNVTQAKVYDNKTSAEKDGIPPHTVWVIVEGGTSEEIGNVIYNNLPPGIPMKGDQVATITRANGDTATVNYDLPDAVQLYVMAKIKNLGTSAIDEQYVKQQLVLNTSFEIGEAVESSNLTTALKNILEETGNPYDVEVSADGVNYVPFLKCSGLADYFVLSIDKIDLTVE